VTHSAHDSVKIMACWIVTPWLAHLYHYFDGARCHHFKAK